MLDRDCKYLTALLEVFLLVYKFFMMITRTVNTIACTKRRLKPLAIIRCYEQLAGDEFIKASAGQSIPLYILDIYDEAHEQSLK